MATLLSIIIILASILLIAVVFIQNPKGGGLSTDFGAAHQLGGVKKTNDFIDKATWTLAGTVMVTSIILSIMLKPAVIKQPTQEQNPKEQGNAPAGQNPTAPKR
ncbi:MAG: preprotein translocase subunit SecG [Flavobacteriia bacterium]|nr:preprotein translocase subunit SecG [Flavobacteriia bacterium]